MALTKLFFSVVRFSVFFHFVLHLFSIRNDPKRSEKDPKPSDNDPKLSIKVSKPLKPEITADIKFWSTAVGRGHSKDRQRRGKKSIDRGGPVWPLRSNAADNCLGGGGLRGLCPPS